MTNITSLLFDAKGEDRKANQMSDLRNAPPSFVNENGDKVIFVDFRFANYAIKLDVNRKEALVETEIVFHAEEAGLPVFALGPRPTSIELDDEIVENSFERAPDGLSHFRRLNKRVCPGQHRLRIKQTLDRTYRAAIPLRWYEGRVHCIFNMTDVFREGGFLESFVPSNLEYDHFRVTIDVDIIGTSENHRVFTNGSETRNSKNSWRVDYPGWFTTSCPWFHCAPEGEFLMEYSAFSSLNGRQIPIRLYALKISDTSKRLIDFAEKAISSLTDLETRFGPYPHSALTIYATAIEGGGMEYAGATATTFGIRAKSKRSNRGVGDYKQDLAHRR